MINNNENSNFEEAERGAKGPISSEKLKEYGKEAYRPFINVVSKYQDTFTPYLDALAKGLQGGVDALKGDGASEEERYVSRFFDEAASGLRQTCEKIKAKDVNALSNYLTEMADKRPSIMFSTSYIAGMFFGRLGRHLVSKHIPSSDKSSTETSFDTTIDDFSSSSNITGPSSKDLNNEPPSFDQSIH